ncbi:MAG: hypothetical protein ACKO0M_01155, partial [Cyanobium sp.]
SLDPVLRDQFAGPLLDQLSRWRREADQGRRRRPLIALNGPVGAGKSTLGRQLEALAPRFGLRLSVASIDDLYLTWPERGERLAGNPFGVSRVPPGSHDLALLLKALEAWRDGEVLRLPRFDKTLAGGAGDRAGWREDTCDALVLEGWLLGCRPLPERQLRALMASLDVGAESGIGPEAAGPAPGPDAPPLQPEEWRWLPRWNRELAAYLPLWEAFDALWLLRPLHWGLPRRWRFQAEARQRRSGGGWLSAADLDRLVRASLCSLPPALYQDPLAAGLAPRGPLDRVSVAGMALQRSDAQNLEDAPGGRHEPDGTRMDPCESRLWGPERGCRDGEGGSPVHGETTVQAVAWLDGRRRCRDVWRQDSLSASSSATG